MASFDLNSLRWANLLACAATDALGVVDDVLFVRRHALPKEQMAMIRRYLQSGKPLVGLRTACHAFDMESVPEPRRVNVALRAIDVDAPAAANIRAAVVVTERRAYHELVKRIERAR